MRENKYILFFLIILLNNSMIFATHNRAGEITYKHLSGLTYEITLRTYTFTPSPANSTRNELEIQWGDGTTSMIPRIEELNLPDNYTRNTYIGQHTFPGPGIYEIVMEDPNRNYGVENIPNSVNVVFAVKTTLMINADIGFNNAPILTNPPIDKAAVNRIFIHNPGAYDPDGQDSLSYTLEVCKGGGGENIPNYSLPEASQRLYVDPITGDFVWNTPVKTGIYNVAMGIEEWRNGVKINKIIRDMQIEVIDSKNHPPIIDSLHDYCIEANQFLSFDVTATDIDNDYITLSAKGGPFQVVTNKAVFPEKTGYKTVTSTFSWQTNCSHVRKYPYKTIFKAKDANTEVDLAYFSDVDITVVGPAPQNVKTQPTNNSVILSWDKSICNEVVQYLIYRRIDKYGYQPDTCVTGVPAYTGYRLIAKNDGYNNTSYVDNNNELGLSQGFIYCYMIVAVFPDGSLSYPSSEICTPLIKGIPIITNVSVDSTHQTKGKIYLAWSKPTEFDSVLAPGPYKYLIYRSNDLWGKNLQLIDSTNTENDTIYYDTNLNTMQNPYSYKVEFYNTSPRFLIGSPQIASSVFLRITPLDNALKINFEKNVPWFNKSYIVYRENKITETFDSIAITDTTFYIDTKLINGTEYCYRVKSIGRYGISKIVNPIINYSQINCAVPVDTFSPCPPTLTVSSICDSAKNILSWSNPNTICADDVIKYSIYYSPTLDGTLNKIGTNENASNTKFEHTNIHTLAGCYAVTAIDSFNNESKFSNKVCIDKCTYYELPNVFTPNNDNINDLFTPGKYRFVEKVDMKIYDRWGTLIFETQDPNINWDGRYKLTGKLVPDGVYYYICDVYEQRLTGIEIRNITGFIYVFGKENKKLK